MLQRGYMIVQQQNFQQAERTQPNMNDIEEFLSARTERIQRYSKDEVMQATADKLLAQCHNNEYYLNFDWMSVPVIQFPQDLVAMQELIWQVKPDLIIETGIARGGSMVYYASMLAMLDLSEGKSPLIEGKETRRKVLGIEIDLREHNKKALDGHFLRGYMEFIKTSSLDPETVKKASEAAKNKKSVLVALDSNHTHEHVLAELENYAPFTTVGSCCVVFDTHLHELGDKVRRITERHGTIGQDACTAQREYMEKIKQGNVKDQNGETVLFEQDKSITQKLLLTSFTEGYLRRTA